MSNLLTKEETKIAREVLKEFFLGLKEFLKECIDVTNTKETRKFSIHERNSERLEYFCLFSNDKGTEWAHYPFEGNILELFTEEQLLNYGIEFCKKHE